MEYAVADPTRLDGHIRLSGYTAVAICDATGITRWKLSRLRAGKTATVTAEEAQRIERYLRVYPGTFFVPVMNWREGQQCASTA